MFQQLVIDGALGLAMSPAAQTFALVYSTLAVCKAIVTDVQDMYKVGTAGATALVQAVQPVREFLCARNTDSRQLAAPTSGQIAEVRVPSSEKKNGNKRNTPDSKPLNSNVTKAQKRSDSGSSASSKGSGKQSKGSN
jgi:hypothetical protein